MKKTGTPSIVVLNSLTVVLFASLFTFTSCLTPRKVDKQIVREYGETIKSKSKNSDYITVKMPTASTDIVAKTEKRQTKVLPLLVYWKWEYGTISTLNAAIPDNFFNSSFISYANSKGLKQKLNGQKLEITIDKMPAVFSVVDKGNMIYLLLYYISWERVFIDPEKQDMVISYRLLKDNAETKKGQITVADRNKPVRFKIFQSGKKTYTNYFEQYNSNIQAMSKEAVDKLMAEL